MIALLVYMDLCSGLECEPPLADGVVVKLAQVKAAEYGKGTTERARKMFGRDCQLMGLTWLLARNKTAYIPTVSAVLRAIMYSAHPRGSVCSPDQENMPLAVDSIDLENAQESYSSSSSPSARSPRPAALLLFPILPLIILKAQL